MRLLVICVLLTGCDLYWGNGDDVCNGGVLYPSTDLRDPETGVCNYYGGGGGGYCCGDSCAYEDTATPGALQDWASCYGACEGLDENSCLDTSGCRAAYLDNPLADGVGDQFWGCWETAPSGPIEGGGCEGLDAYACSRHDDCSAVYGGTGNGEQKFDRCIAEPAGQCGGVDCGDGAHCEEQCTPCDTTDGSMCTSTCQPMCVPDETCADVDCGPGTTCAEQCDATTDLVGACHPTCVPTNQDPGSCTGSITCGLMAPACPAGSTAGIANGCYTGYCIPNADCGAHDPGQCYATATCATPPPQCPSGTLPGVANGCYTGYCIPTGSCELAACETLPTEQACSGRADCTPVYTGTDCTCYPGYCDCEVLTYARCESQLMPL
jgi:hypothetical protein